MTSEFGFDNRNPAYEPTVIMAKNNFPFLCYGLAVLLLALSGTMAFADDILKANNATDLNVGASWVGAAVPDSDDVAVWSDTVTGANTTALGGSLSWQGILINGTTQTGLVRINGAGIPLTLGNAGIDLSASPRNLTVFSSVVLGTAQDWNVGTGRTLTVGDFGTGNVTGSGAITKKGNGTLIMGSSGAGNNYSGDLTIEGGTLAVKFDGTRSATGNITLKNNTTVANNDAADSSLVVAGSTRTTFIDGNVTFVGTNGGLASTARLTLGGNVLLTGNRTIEVSNAPNVNGGGFVQIPAGAGNGISDGGNAYSLTKAGIGTLRVERASTYTGGTYVHGGILELSTFSNLLASGTLIEVNGGNLFINGGSQTAGTVNLVSGSITGTGGSLTGTSFNMSSGTVSKALAGVAAPLIKDTAGTVILSATNTYTGATTVNGGTLLVNGSLAAGSAVSVGANGTLGGNGTIGGATAVAGTLSPGNSAGILTISNNATITNGGTLAIELDGLTFGTEYDRLALTGTAPTFSLTDTNNLELSLGFVPSVDDLFFIATVTGSNAISGVFEELNGATTTLTQNSTFSFGGYSWQISYTGDVDTNTFSGAGNDLALQVIPEPTTALLGMLGLAALAALRRRRLASK